MTAMVRPKSGFGFLGFAAVIIMLTVIVTGIGTLAIPVTMTENTEQAKLPTDMDDTELQAELDIAEVDVVAAEQSIIPGDTPSQADYEAALAARKIAGERFIAANEEATRRGWYTFSDLYTLEDFNAIESEWLEAANYLPTVDVPGIDFRVRVMPHYQKHGEKAWQVIQTGKGPVWDCEQIDKIYKAVEIENGHWAFAAFGRTSHILITSFPATENHLCRLLLKVTCKLLNGHNGHDNMSASF